MSYTKETVEYVLELANHINDPHNRWHNKTKENRIQVLVDPTKKLIENIRPYIDKLNSSVANEKHILGALKKQGKDGNWCPYYWFAFYDPKAGKKKNSSQLFFFWIVVKRVESRGGTMVLV
jgi:hypothetical protein